MLVTHCPVTYAINAALTHAKQVGIGHTAVRFLTTHNKPAKTLPTSRSTTNLIEALKKLFSYCSLHGYKMVQYDAKVPICHGGILSQSSLLSF
jgi:hypothetical protein